MHKDMGKKVKDSYNIELDNTDREIMQTLSDELSEIKVSEELIARTLLAAGNNAECQIVLPNKNLRRKRARPYRFLGGTIAAAVLLFVIFMLGVQKRGMKEDADGFFDYFSEANFQPNTSGGQQEGKVILEGEGTENPADILKTEDTGEWLYQELLAAFSAEGEDSSFSDAAINEESEESDDLVCSPEESKEEESRKIVWQRGDRILTCVIYLPDYRIEAVLQEKDKMQQISIKDFVYAEELWEFAAGM